MSSFLPRQKRTIAIHMPLIMVLVKVLTSYCSLISNKGKGHHSSRETLHAMGPVLMKPLILCSYIYVYIYTIIFLASFKTTEDYGSRGDSGGQKEIDLPDECHSYVHTYICATVIFKF